MVPRIYFLVRDHRQNAAAPLVACGVLVCVAIKSWLRSDMHRACSRGAGVFHAAAVGTAEISKIADGLAAEPTSAKNCVSACTSQYPNKDVGWHRLLKWRLCSVPFHDSFQEASSLMMKSLS